MSEESVLLALLSLAIPDKFTHSCLTINVQRPVGISATAKLPVMVWVSSFPRLPPSPPLLHTPLPLVTTRR